MNSQLLTEKITELLGGPQEVALKGVDPHALGLQLQSFMSSQMPSPFILSLTVFALAVFVGNYVVWKVTPALHSPLMSVTNAISSVIIVGAILAAGGGDPENGNALTQWSGFIAVTVASINIFGGFVVTRRMLQMFDIKK